MANHDQNDGNGTCWVFGYGSLIWNPGFAFVSAQQALLRGSHRALSIISYHHRGTREQPGLVFGLTRGGSCRGMAFEVDRSLWQDVHGYLRGREMITSVYREVMRPVTLADGRRIAALAYVVDERHEQFAGPLTLESQLAMIRAGVGISGRNVDYVINTARHLRQLGIEDRALMALALQLEADASGQAA